MARAIRLFPIVLVVVFIPVILLSGFYAFVYWKLTEAADEIAFQIAPKAAMTYQGVHIDLIQKKLGLEGVKLELVNSQGAINIEALKLQAPSWAYFLSFQQSIDKQSLPEFFAIQVQGLNLDLYSPYMDEWARALRADNPQQAETSTCYDHAQLSIMDLREMQFSTLKTDISLDYSFAKHERIIRLDLAVATKPMLDLRLLLDIVVSADDLDMQSLMFAQPQLQRLEMRYKDKGLNRRLISHCAKLRQQTEAEYLSAQAQTIQQQLSAQGWQIPSSILQQLAKLNHADSSVLIRIAPPKALGVQSMLLIQKPADVLTVLDPYVEINAKPIALDGIRWQAPKQSAATMSQPSFSKTTAPYKPSPEQQNSQAALGLINAPYKSSFDPVPVKSFQRVDVTTLDQYIGKKVQLYTYFGKNVEGILVAKNRSEIKVKRRPEGGRGTAVYPIALNKVHSAKVFH